MGAAAMEKKRLGLCSKTMIVVPNHLTEQIGSELLTLYPNANILVAEKRDFEKDRRRLFCSRIATGNYDIVILGHSQLPHADEFRQIVEPGKPRFHAVAGPFGGQLHSADRFAKVGRPCVEGVQAMLTQGIRLYIAHHGVEFRSRVADGRAGAEHNAFAARDRVQVLALHEQVCGLSLIHI